MVVVVVFFGPTWFTSCASLAVMRRLNSPVRPPIATTVNRLTVVAACACPHVRLITRRAYGFHSPQAALALVMLSCGPIELTYPTSESPVTHTHAGVCPERKVMTM